MDIYFSMDFGPSAAQLAHDLADQQVESGHALADLSKDKLLSLLHSEKLENAQLKKEVHSLKAELAQVALRAEEEDERLALGLLKQVDFLKKHEERALNQAEADSERVTNRLQIQVEKLKAVNQTCSRSFEAEQELVMNKSRKIVQDAHQETLKWKTLYEQLLLKTNS